MEQRHQTWQRIELARSARQWNVFWERLLFASEFQLSERGAQFTANRSEFLVVAWNRLAFRSEKYWNDQIIVFQSRAMHTPWFILLFFNQAAVKSLVQMWRKQTVFIIVHSTCRKGQRKKEWKKDEERNGATSTNKKQYCIAIRTKRTILCRCLRYVSNEWSVFFVVFAQSFEQNFKKILLVFVCNKTECKHGKSQPNACGRSDSFPFVKFNSIY